MWGLRRGSLDLSAVNTLYNASAVGEPMRDPRFRLDGDAQQHVARACELLRVEIVRSAPDLSTGEIKPMVHCWIDEFKAWRGRQAAASHRGRGPP